MKDFVTELTLAVVVLATELAKVVRYAVGSNERTTRLAALIIIVMVGLFLLHRR